MNSETRDLIFRAKNLRRKELATMSVSDKVRLIDALHDAGLHLRNVRPQVGSVSVGVTLRRPQPSVFENVQTRGIVALDSLEESMLDAA